ncbi:hypothetical protein SeLEV6574_g05470 [Synchytrium endobioticum]|nr:hypothetical protein SeLEV6574_g05470 [Synchytrium endobioticum]
MNSQQSPSQTQTVSTRPRSAVSSPARLEDEYVKNLQQQLYLLELETRYLRGNRGGGMSTHSMGDSGENSSVGGLKQKYVELQTAHKQEVKKLQDIIDDLRRRQDGIADSSDAHELRTELQTVKDDFAIQKDKLCGENIQLRRQLDSAEADKIQIDGSLRRVSADFHVQRTRCSELTDEVARLREQLNEQLTSNSKYTKRMEELTRTAKDLQLKIEEGESGPFSIEYESQKRRLSEIHQENLLLLQEIKQMQVSRAQDEHYRQRVLNDCADLVKENVALRKDLEEERRKLRSELERRDQKIKRRQENIREADAAREELERLRDEKATSTIRAEAHERRIQELTKEVREKDSLLSKALESKALQEDRIKESERRLEKSETELIKLAQDKRALFDDLALVKNQLDIQTHKQNKALHEKRELQRELDMFRKEHAARLKLAETVQGLQGAETQYLDLVREVSRITPSS